MLYISIVVGRNKTGAVYFHSFFFFIFIVTTIFACWFSIFIFLESLQGISVSCFVRYVSQWYIIPGLYICCSNMFASIQPKAEYYIDI